MTFPTAKLRIECAMTNALKPLGVSVLIDEKIIATVSLSEVREAAHKLEELELRQRGFLK